MSYQIYQDLNRRITMIKINRSEYMELLRINPFRVKRTKQGFYRLDINKYIKNKNSNIVIRK